MFDHIGAIRVIEYTVLRIKNTLNSIELLGLAAQLRTYLMRSMNMLLDIKCLVSMDKLVLWLISSS